MYPASFKNKLICKMSPLDLQRLDPWFERVELQRREILLKRGDLIDYIYFPETGHASVLVKAPQSDQIEVGTIGSEGMTDFALSGRAIGETLMQTPGEAIRIRRTAFLEALHESQSLALLMLKWHQALIAQISFTALSHGAYTVTERLARFVLMLDDRAENHELSVPHEYFAWMLSVRRAGVTESIHRLSDAGAIDARRGRLVVVDRGKLIEMARGSYGPAEAEYERIFAA